MKDYTPENELISELGQEILSHFHSSSGEEVGEGNRGEVEKSVRAVAEKHDWEISGLDMDYIVKNV